MNKMLIGFYLKIVIVIAGMLFSKIGFFTLIMSYIWMGDATQTEVIYFISTIFIDLEYNLGQLIPYGMAQAAELYSSIVRINRVISAEEIPPTDDDTDKAQSNPHIELRNVVVHIRDHELLKDINFKSDGGLTIVTGAVGSGKSSLLKAMLQDYPLTSGSVISHGRISYASQDPWLFPSTIRQNILFGEKYNEKR